MEITGTWLDKFELFSLTHAAIILLSGLSIGAACMIGRRLRRTGSDRQFVWWWGVFIVVAQTAHLIWWCMPERLSWDNSLRLNLCDLAAPLAALVCFVPWRWPRVTLFYWGLGLSSWAFLTPVVKLGPAHLIFWMFWINHIQIVGMAIYDVAVRELRPGWRDFRTGFLASLIYLCIVFPLNLLLGTNLGFVGPAGTGGNSPIDALGPWPWRTIPLALAVTAGMAVMTVLARLIGRSRPERSSTGDETAPPPSL